MWYKEPYAWVVFLLPLATVVASIMTVVIAVHEKDSVVSETLVKEGMFYKETRQ